MSEDLTALNTQLKALGIEAIKDVETLPERVAYFEHLSKQELENPKWVKKLATLERAYLASFHVFVMEQHPHLRFEKNEDHTWWNYDAERGVYEEMSGVQVRGMVMKMLIDEGMKEKATEYYARSILGRLRAVYGGGATEIDDFDNDEQWFHVKNGWVNVETGELEPHTPKRLSRLVADVVFDPEAKCPRYDKFLDEECGVPKDAVRVIDQFSGLLLTNDVRYQKMLTIIGRPGSGKSTLIQAWFDILGERATQRRLTDLSGDSFRFAGADLMGKTLCWFDEVDVKRSEMSNNVGNLITSETIRVERKGVNGIVDAENSLKCVLTANTLPISAEHGTYRRLILIYFGRSFYDEGIHDIHVLDTLREEKSGIFNRMLRGLADLRKMRGFTVIAGHEDLIEEYKASSDDLADFLDTHFEPCENDESELLPTTQIFDAYQQYMKNNRWAESLTARKFGRLLAAQPLNKFARIKSVRGTDGVRGWKGLKLAYPYQWDEVEGVGWRIRSVEESSF